MKRRMNKWAGKGWQEWVGLEPIDPTKFTATITIEDENEDAVVGALITLTNTEDLSVVFSGTTDEGGVCSISNIEPKGTYSLLATHDNYESIEQSITIDSNISIPLVATAKSVGFKISGLISDEESTPIENATVTLQKGVSNIDSCTTDNNGTYEFNNVIPASDYTIVVEATGYAKNDADIAVGSSDVVKNFTMTANSE